MNNANNTPAVTTEHAIGERGSFVPQYRTHSLHIENTELLRLYYHRSAFQIFHGFEKTQLPDCAFEIFFHRKQLGGVFNDCDNQRQFSGLFTDEHAD